MSSLHKWWTPPIMLEKKAESWKWCKLWKKELLSFPFLLAVECGGGEVMKSLLCFFFFFFFSQLLQPCPPLSESAMAGVRPTKGACLLKGSPVPGTVRRWQNLSKAEPGRRIHAKWEAALEEILGPSSLCPFVSFPALTRWPATRTHVLTLLSLFWGHSPRKHSPDEILD